MHAAAVGLCTTSNQGISFWEISSLDWQIQPFSTEAVEQQWFLSSNDWKQSIFTKAIQHCAFGQEIPSRLACVTQQHELFVVDLAKCCMIWPIRKVQAYEITRLCFFHHDDLLCIGTKNGEIKLFQLDDEKLLKTVALSSHPISLMTASKHGFLAVQVDGNRIVILSLVEERIVDNMLEPFDCGITDIAFSPLHPSLLAVAGDDGSITVVDIHSTSDCFVKIRFSSAHISPVSSIAFSPTNSCLLCSVGLDKRLCFFDVEKKKKRIRMFPLNDYCESLQFLNSGSHLIISFQRGQLSLFDLRGGIQERSAITTGQVIQSICILNDSMAAWAAQQRTERNSDNIGRQSESVAQEKENMAFNTMHHNNSRVVSPAKQDNEFDFVKLVQRNRNSSMLDDSPANSRSMAVVTSSGHRSESWSKQALSSCDERKHSQPLNNEIPTKENFSRTFSASWEETPISISKEQRNSENSLLLSSTLNRPVPCEDSNPFHCLLRTESPSLGAIPSPTTKKQIIAHDTNNNNVDPCNDNNNNNMYFSLLQSIEDIQYESTREMKQHIQNLHIDMLRNFEEQQNRIEQLEQQLQQTIKRMNWLERQQRILLGG